MAVKEKLKNLVNKLVTRRIKETEGMKKAQKVIEAAKKASGKT